VANKDILSKAKDFLSGNDDQTKIIKAYKQVFSRGDAAVELVLGDLVKFCRLYGPLSNRGEVEDTHKMAMREGMRNVMLRIISRIEMDGDDYYQLREKEQNE